MNQKTPEEWFNTIADKEIREAAIAAIKPYVKISHFSNLIDAFYYGMDWNKFRSKYHPSDILKEIIEGTLKLRKAPEKEEEVLGLLNYLESLPKNRLIKFSKDYQSDDYFTAIGKLKNLINKN